MNCSLIFFYPFLTDAAYLRRELYRAISAILPMRLQITPMQPAPTQTQPQVQPRVRPRSVAIRAHPILVLLVMNPVKLHLKFNLVSDRNTLDPPKRN